MTQRSLNSQNTCPKLLLHIRGTQQKPGTKVMYAFLFGSWLMVGLWLIVSLFLFNYNWPWACLMLSCTLIFGWYLRTVDSRLENLRSKSFELKLDAEKIVMAVFDVRSSEQSEQSFEWNDVRRAEVYRYSDEPTIVLRGSDSSLEIPFWAFGTGKKRALMKALQDKQIPLVRIP